MAKWEYKYILYDVDFINVELLLNELGSDGWEICYMDFKGGAFRAILKRNVNMALCDTNLPWRTRRDFDQYYSSGDTKCNGVDYCYRCTKSNGEK